MPKKHWMRQAFANSHGQFKAKAEREGESTGEFAHEHEHSKGKLGKQARLAEVGMASHKHKKLASHKEIRQSMYGE